MDRAKDHGPSVAEMSRRVLEELRALPDSHPARAAYANDLAAWAAEQAALLRAGQPHEADLANIAEEIEDLGKAERRRLESQIQVVVEHLMKLEASPASLPRAGWRGTVTRARIQIRKALAHSPSLRPLVPDLVAEAVADARRVVAADLADFGEPGEGLAGLDYTAEQLLDEGWWPEAGP